MCFSIRAKSPIFKTKLHAEMHKEYNSAFARSTIKKVNYNMATRKLVPLSVYKKLPAASKKAVSKAAKAMTKRKPRKRSTRKKRY